MPTLSCEPYIVLPGNDHIEVRYADATGVLPLQLFLSWYEHILAEKVFEMRLSGRAIATLRDPSLLHEYNRLRLMRDDFRYKIARQCSSVNLLELDFYKVMGPTLDIAFVIDNLTADLSPKILAAFKLFVQRIIHRKGNVWAFIKHAEIALETRITVAGFADKQRCMIGDPHVLARLWSDFIAGKRVNAPHQWNSKM